jgi:hypothetical protein
MFEKSELSKNMKTRGTESQIRGTSARSQDLDVSTPLLENGRHMDKMELLPLLPRRRS